MSRLYQKKYLKMYKDRNIKCKMLGLSKKHGEFFLLIRVKFAILLIGNLLEIG